MLPEASLYSGDSSERLTFPAESGGIYICCREGRGGETSFCPRALLCLGLTSKPLKLPLVSISTILQKFEQLMKLGAGEEKNQVFCSATNLLCGLGHVAWLFCASLTS